MSARKAWKGFRSVLCPIDFSEHSRLALRYAASVAARSRALLTVAYVNDPLLVAAAATALHDRQLAAQCARELQDFVDATLPPASRRRCRVKTRVSIGQPAEEITGRLGRTGADLIVMGTHGATGASRLLIGSTTLRVLQRTTVPVLAIPRAGEALIAEPSASWPGERILAALELDASAGKDADVAARIASWFGSSLLLIHVVADVVAPAWLTADLSADNAIRVANAQQRLEQLAKRGRSMVPIEAQIVCGRAGDELAAIAAAERSGLMITALRDRRGWFGARRGSVSYHVLTHAAAPVLACPPSWRPL
jgi:nucleotide-binding universal stress UspA family protein